MCVMWNVGDISLLMREELISCYVLVHKFWAKIGKVMFSEV